MRWSSQLFFAILIAIVTGTIAKLFWEAARVWIAGRNPKLAYQLLRVVCILYIFPFAYIGIQLTVRDGYIQTDDIWQLNFMATDIVNLLLGAAGLVWIGLSIGCLGQYALQSMRWNRQFWDSIPVEDEMALVEFARVKEARHAQKGRALLQSEDYKPDGDRLFPVSDFAAHAQL